MRNTQVIDVNEIGLDPTLAATMHNVAGQLAPTSRKNYTHDAKHFAGWMTERGLAFQTLSRDDLVDYRAHLSESYAKATASHMWAVARRLLDEAVRRHVLTGNPAEGIRGFKAGDDESPHLALKREEARALLDGIDRGTALSKRDYALILLLLRTVSVARKQQPSHSAISRWSKAIIWRLSNMARATSEDSPNFLLK